jgi:hypothetical protein
MVIYANFQSLLDEGIQNPENVSENPSLSTDIFYGGSSKLWIEVAWTKQARCFLQTKQYSQVFATAQSSATHLPDRFIYANSELNANSQAPPDPGLYSPTEVNK